MTEIEEKDSLKYLLLSSLSLGGGVENALALKDIELIINNHNNVNIPIISLVETISDYSLPLQCRLLSSILLKNFILKKKKAKQCLDLNYIFTFFSHFIINNEIIEDPRIIIQISLLCSDLSSLNYSKFDGSISTTWGQVITENIINNFNTMETNNEINAILIKVKLYSILYSIIQCNSKSSINCIILFKELFNHLQFNKRNYFTNFIL